MRPPKEIVVLLVLLVLAMASVLWYVIDRRARLLSPSPVAVKATGSAPAGPAGPAGQAGALSAGQANAPVDLTQHDGQTIDFSSGRPVVKQTPEDKAALNAGLKDIADATQDVTFGPPKKPAEPPPAPAKH